MPTPNPTAPDTPAPAEGAVDYVKLLEDEAADLEIGAEFAESVEGHRSLITRAGALRHLAATLQRLRGGAGDAEALVTYFDEMLEVADPHPRNGTRQTLEIHRNIAVRVRDALHPLLPGGGA